MDGMTMDGVSMDGTGSPVIRILVTLILIPTHAHISHDNRRCGSQPRSVWLSAKTIGASSVQYIQYIATVWLSATIPVQPAESSSCKCEVRIITLQYLAYVSTVPNSTV